MYGTQFAQIIPPRALDSDQSHFLHHLAGSDLTANRDLTWLTGDADRLATLQGDPLLDDWFDQNVKTSASPTFAGVVLSGLEGIVKATAGVLSGGSNISDLGDAATAGAAADDFLKFDGAAWVDFDLFGVANVWAATNQFDAAISFDDANHTIGASGDDLTYEAPGEHKFIVNNSAELSILANELSFEQPGIPAHTVGFKFATNDELDVDIDGTRQITFTDGTIQPVTNNDIDLGVVGTQEFKDAFFAGEVRTKVVRMDGTAAGVVNNVTLTGVTSQTANSIVTLGDIAGKGETGPSTAAQWGWLKIYDGVNLAFLPIWR